MPAAVKVPSDPKPVVMAAAPMRLTALGAECLAIVTLPQAENAGKALDWLATALPAARSAGGGNGGIAALASGGQGSSAAVVVPETALKAVPPPEGATAEQPWIALQVAPAVAAQKGPSCALAIAHLGGLLSAAAVRWRAIPASGESTVLLVRQEDMPVATVALTRQGHSVAPSLRVCLPAPEEDKAASEHNGKYVGAWCLLKREEPAGRVIEDHKGVDGPMRLQAPSGLFAEIRIPLKAEDVLKQESCAGYHTVVDSTKKGKVSLRHRAIDFRPPKGCVLCTQVKFDHEVMAEVSHPSGRCRDEYVEAWRRLSEGPVAALELISEHVPGAPANRKRAGYWLFCGEYFARMLGPPRGEGVVAGTCCSSLAQLEVLFGAKAVEEELRTRFEACLGKVEAPGVLRITREAWQPERSGQLFFDHAAGVGGHISVSKTEVLHRLAAGGEQRWRIRDWGFDPFRPGQKDAMSAAAKASAAKLAASQAAVKAAMAAAAAAAVDDEDSESSSSSASPSKSPVRKVVKPQLVPAAKLAPAPKPTRESSRSSSRASDRSRGRRKKAAEKKERRRRHGDKGSRGRRRRERSSHKRRRRRSDSKSQTRRDRKKGAYPYGYMAPPGSFPYGAEGAPPATYQGPPAAYPAASGYPYSPPPPGYPHAPGAWKAGAPQPAGPPPGAAPAATPVPLEGLAKGAPPRPLEEEPVPSPESEAAEEGGDKVQAASDEAKAEGGPGNSLENGTAAVTTVLPSGEVLAEGAKVLPKAKSKSSASSGPPPSKSQPVLQAPAGAWREPVGRPPLRPPVPYGAAPVPLVPMPVPGLMWPQPPGAPPPVDPRLDWFCGKHMVDSNAAQALRRLHPEAQRRVIDEGALGPSNPSADLMERVRRIEAWEHSFHVGHFLPRDYLSSRAKDSFYELTIEGQRAVMAFGPLTSRDPSAELLGRIRDATSRLPKDRALLREAVSRFCAECNLDGKSEEALRALPPALQQRVLDEGPLHSRATNVAQLVMARIKRVRETDTGRGYRRGSRSRSR